MAHAPTPQPRRPSSTPVADAARPDAAARPDDAARAWAFLARRTAWEQRLDALRRTAGTTHLAPTPHRAEPEPAAAVAHRTEAA